MPLTKEWSDQICIVVCACMCICVCAHACACVPQLKQMSSDNLGCWFLPSSLFERGSFSFLLTAALKPLGIFLPLLLISGNTGITVVYVYAWLYRGFGYLSSSPHACTAINLHTELCPLPWISIHSRRMCIMEDQFGDGYSSLNQCQCEF